jgi:hypothetical protein
MAGRILMASILLLIFLLLLVAFFKHSDPETVSGVNNFIGVYQAILTSIGTLILIIALTFITTIVSNESAAKRDISNRKVAAELKIVEFRQKWIDELRSDIAEFLSLTGNDVSSIDLDKLHLLNVRIQLRLNPNEDATGEMLGIISKILQAIRGDDDRSLTDAQTAMQLLASDILKTEWDRIKSDLKNAQISVQA